MRSLVTIVGLFTILFSCTKETEETLITTAVCKPYEGLDSVKFAEHIFPLITTHCMPCHDTVQAQGGITLMTYDDISFQATDGALLTSINQTSGAIPMPKDREKLKECLIQAIELWTSQGALDN